MTPQLHPIAGKNRFCGPTALASVLGITTDHAARLIRKFSGDKRVTGVYETHLLKALAAAGCKSEYHNGAGEGGAMLSAREWVKAHRALFASTHVIISFGRHYGTLLGEHYQCSLTHRMVPLTEMPQGHELVRCYFVIHGLPSATPQDEEAIERKRNAQAMGKAKALACKFGIVIQSILGGNEYLVYSPELADDDPHDHLPNPTSGQEVLALVKSYADCLRNGYLEAVTDPRLYSPAVQLSA